jgi:predicted metal-binding protein
MVEIKKLTADVDVEEFIENYVDIERFMGLCEECENYGKNWNCPPFDFDVMEVWNSFNKLKIIAFKLDFSDEELNMEYSEKELEFILKRLERMKVKLMNEIYALEDENSLGLFLGNCNLCMKCTREFGMPCKMPFKMRYSIESLGGNVDQLIEDIFGFKILYAKDNRLPEYLIFVGGVLFDKK